MAERVPPGRAGRLWLQRRLASTRRSMELLDRKRQLLRREQERLAERQEKSAAEWGRACSEAERWAVRAGCLGGATEVAMVGARLVGRARVEVAWRNTMGVRHPDGVGCTIPDLGSVQAAAANAAVAPAAAAHRRALRAAAEHAADRRSSEVIEAELRATEQRLRAIEHRRLPALEDTLRILELHLDELEREERVVGRWAHERIGEKA